MTFYFTSARHLVRLSSLTRAEPEGKEASGGLPARTVLLLGPAESGHPCLFRTSALMQVAGACVSVMRKVNLSVYEGERDDKMMLVFEGIAKAL